jgi:tetratricopeptide (TPR) repeat protein
LGDVRAMAINKWNRANALLLQGKYAEALASLVEARTLFEEQNEPESVAGIWHQIGMVHQEAGDYEQAEAAYRRSLEIKSQNDDRGGQANSLTNLGVLYKQIGRLEEAVVFYRQAADVYVEIADLRNEGTTRNNVANSLSLLKRYDEARAEIMRAIECDKPFGHAAEPWKTFEILRQIEEATANPTAAHAAWVQARDVYLAYRRQGGYAQQGHSPVMEHVVSLISQQKIGEIQELFNQWANEDDTTDELRALMNAIIAILNGSRDRALGDDDALNYADAAEVLFLMERLEQ